MAGSKKTLSIEMRLRDFASKNLDRIRGKTALMAAKMVKGFKKVGKAITSVKGLMVGFIAILAVRRVANFVIGLVEMEDKLSKMARSIGSTTEELSALQFAFERSGLEIQKVEILLTGFGRARSQAFRADAAKRVNDQVRAFQLLGVSIQDLRTKGAVRIFEDLADGLERVAKSQGQTALQALFPDNFLKLFPLLSEGGANFRRLIKDAERFGAVISTKAGKAAEKFVDTMTNFKSITESVFRDLINRFLPDITAVLEGITETVLNNKEAFIGFATALVDFIKTAATQAFGAIIATFEAIEDLVGRTSREIQAEISNAKKELDNLLSSGTSSSGRSQEIFRVTKRLEILNKELADTNFGKAQKAAEAFAKAMTKVGLAIDGTRISLEDALKNAEALKAALEEGIDAKAITEPGLSQAVEMTDGFRLATIAIRDAKNELVTMNEEGKNLLETARQLEALPAAFIGPERAGQKRQGLASPFGPELPAGFQKPLTDAEERARLLNSQKLPPAFIGAPRPGQPQRDLPELPDLSGLEQFNEGVQDALAGLENLRDAGADLVFSLADGLGGAMTSFLDGTLSAKEAFKQFAKDMLKQLAQVIIKLLIAKALQAALGGVGGAVGGAKEGGVFPAAAKGGVFPEFGGRFAGGGIVPGRSQLITVGEGGRREAVIPLDDNRAVPVNLRGAGGFNITNNFHFQGSSGESLEQVRRNRNEIVAIINRSIQNNEGGMRRTIQEIGK